MVAAVVLLILVVPILVVIAGILLILNGRPVFYHESRIGCGQRPFVLYKFRTLLPDVHHSASVAASNDVRLCRGGLLLRRSRLDELPQLVNILLGDMALVGPRPMPAKHFDSLDPMVRKQVTAVKPGLTGPAAIAFIAEDDVLATVADPERTYIERILPAKVEMELRDIEQATLIGDMQVIITTLLSLASRKAWQESVARIRQLIATVDISPF